MCVPRGELKSKRGNEGHLARDCQAAPAGGAGGGWGNVGGNAYGGGSARECYRCGGQGHIARDCTSGGQGGYGGGYSRGGGGQTCYSCGGVATAPKVELKNATTVVNKAIFRETALLRRALSASATNASNRDICSLHAQTRGCTTGWLNSDAFTFSSQCPCLRHHSSNSYCTNHDATRITDAAVLEDFWLLKGQAI
ncbi:hypothetical protein HRR78_008270 [Exophiala dermatitidis]|nr:hypothetical protein HRR75_008333 [Exophiala dermatitidis]KAJ4538209.1 hypothetical protein HRR78_008270 [Exophiala dermatitidis]